MGGAVTVSESLPPAAADSSSWKTALKTRESGSQLLSTRKLDPELISGVDGHIQTLHRPMSVISEQYRALRSHIEKLSPDRRMQTIAVTSALKGEGKSVSATNLAVVLAQDAAKEILLIDADLRRPNLHRLLGIDQAPGLAECLQGEVGLDAIIRHTPYFGLSVVTAGDAQGHPAELLASPKFHQLVSGLAPTFDYVIVDTPPIHLLSDVKFLTDSVDGVLLVVQANKTSKTILKEAVESLPTGKIIGTVLNRAVRLSRGYGYRKGGYYYRYY
jgi:capsular exopolysaccharide synthesis family protein